MSDLPITSLQEKTTPAVTGDFVVMIDSEDGNKVKKQEALQYKWPAWDTWPAWPTGATWATWPTGDTWPAGATWPQWATWDTGATWPQWDVWPTWATWPAWADWLSVNWKWAYDNATDYIVNDSVEYNGSSYICILDSTWNIPTNTTYWGVLAEKGTDWTWAWDFLADWSVAMTWNIDLWTNDIVNIWTVDWRDVSADWTKLDTVENNATADQTDAEIKTAYENNADTNAFTDAEKTLLWNQSGTNTGDQDLSWLELKTNKITAFQTIPDDTHYISEKLAKDSLDSKEPTITKSTAFNKDFWTAAWTVLEWNTNVWIVWTKEVDETNLADWNAIQYDSASGQYKSVPFPTWWASGWIETVKIAWEQVAWTYYFEYDADSDKTVGNVVIALEVANTGADFIVKCYKNWTDLSKDITIADWWWTAVNWRYKASLDVNEDLSADDVFELKIHQVWSDTAGSEFSSLINIT